MREPTAEEIVLGVEAVGLPITEPPPPNAESAVLVLLGAAWSGVEANLQGRAAAIVKTKIEEAALWVSRCVER